MLEFKDARIALGGGRLSTPISAVINQGEMVCVSGPVASGKSGLLRAVMGLAPVQSGHITIDGELVAPGASGYLRGTMSYVPQQLPDVTMKVSELCQYVFRLQVNQSKNLRVEAMIPYLQELSMSGTVLRRDVNEMDSRQLRLVMISMLPLLRRPIILVDNAPQMQCVHDFFCHLTANGSELLYTCEENQMDCDKLLKL